MPDGWCWCKLEEIAQSNIGLTYKPTDITLDGIPVLRSNNIQNNKLCLDDVVRVSTDIRANQFVSEGDLLVCARNGSRRLVGKCALIPPLEETCSFGAFMAICTGQYNEWLFYVLSSTYFSQYLDDSNSTTIYQVTQKMLLELPIPFPPVLEQKRIVTEINRYFSFVDTLDECKTDLNITIAAAKSKVLDLAIHGKLIPQNPSDEPASELLKRINPKAIITGDNPQYQKPYDIPEGWTWCKLLDICSFLSRGKSPVYSNTDRRYPVFAQKCNLKEGGISLEKAQFLDPATLKRWPEEYKLQTGDILVNSTGTGTVGRTRLFDSSYLGDYPFVVPDSHVSVIRTYNDIDSGFIFSIMSSPWIQSYLEDNLAGSTNQKELYISVLQNIDIPLPPINEQSKIALKVSELFEGLDKIQTELEA